MTTTDLQRDFGPDSLKPQLAPLRDRRWVVALSGGLDSVVLLDLVRRLHDQGFVARLEALHINHGLSPHADQWQQHCQTLCERWRIPLQSVAVSLDREGANLEEQAREARYRVMAERCGAGDGFLFAHHQQDQEETLLYRLLRGGGVRGLAAIPRSRPLGAGLLLRPLLDYPRAQLLDYGRARGLQWVEDESNESLRFDRNYLRHRVLPPLRERWPDLGLRLSRQAQRMADDSALLDELALEDLESCAAVDTPTGPGLSADNRLYWPPVASRSRLRQRNLLRFWLRRLGVPVPGETITEQLLRLASSRVDANPCVRWLGWEVRRYRGTLVVLRTRERPGEGGDLSLQAGEWPLANNGVLRVRRSSASGNPLSACLGSLRVAYRLEGEEAGSIRLAGRKGSKPFKKLMQEQGVPPWLRERWPLLMKGDALVALPSIGVVEGYTAASGEEGVELEWVPPKWDGVD
ncbi:tRNA lysidine(34) synthetase TilS [Aestuariirhabdus litorea]|uniref:tRNA(Ile)-lysidine synthase n=1 Tax=Aestuariirhabdus litorea TaxID=2528527 RepID=A0A3P3VWJ5_9GAMM|nr:tRNA lysidine(34) synthetase TilS [Aestuariirhabdus litorea]RRJ85093.1 tRNA lysidine(34) synthetase TilS [Aestuariirhabdus litorea]RWW98319.1 tRNA lysidine(34) synthetase TilS [Endozoicomonadaceae bacterium GTF-13]